MRVEILVEEESIKSFLEAILPIICEGTKWAIGENMFIRPFEGKSHLKKELPRKAKVYAHYPEPVFLLVLHDQDSNDCINLKNEIVELIKPSGLTSYKVRIVCKELECWYLGDLDAIESVAPASKASGFKNKAKFKNPEKLNGKDELKKWVSPYSAIQFAKKIAPRMNFEENCSVSFQHTIAVLKEILQ